MFTDRSTRRALAGIVVLHLLITLVHGVTHVAAPVALAPWAMALVLVVIVMGPIAGLACMRVRPAAGALIVGITLAASGVFGLVNHFLIQGSDHVAHVAGPWRLLFGATAMLLLVTETAGAAIALSSAFSRNSRI
jgi:hypothetical protein